MKIHPNFRTAITACEQRMRTLSYEIDNRRWQSRDVSSLPGSKMRELWNTSFEVPLIREDLPFYRQSIEPNLPWADDHFEERVSGRPLNPGEQWKNWPWSNSADTFRTENEGFSHTYMERYWPKFANTGNPDWRRQGIRYDYGDLHDVVNLLSKDPETRQAFLPVWFPEDTGVVHGERVPCTLGYHFLMRYNYLHVTYYIRSCDLTRHFRDDLYLTVRLLLWILQELRKTSEIDWNVVEPGRFVFHCASLHCFENDYRILCQSSVSNLRT